jgi:uncharacterized membrane protein YhaH (DUF805 family)
MNYYRKVLTDYIVFEGRSRRSEFWVFNFTNAMLIGSSVFCALLIHNELFYRIIFSILSVFSLAILLPTLAVTIRRLHDTDRNGWWILINIVPVIGNIIFFFFLIEDSSPSYNGYGEYPKFKML